MGQIVSAAAKPKRCNLQSLSSLGTPAAGEYILVSSDNSMNAAGQGNFDCYIEGDGHKAATALELKSVVNDTLVKELNQVVSGKYDYSFYAATGEHSGTLDLFPIDYKAGTTLKGKISLGTANWNGASLSVYLRSDNANVKAQAITIGQEFEISANADAKFISFYIYNITSAGTFIVNLDYGGIEKEIDEIEEKQTTIVNDLGILRFTFSAAAGEHSSALDKMPVRFYKGDIFKGKISLGTAAFDGSSLTASFFNSEGVVVTAKKVSMGDEFSLRLNGDVSYLSFYIYRITRGGTFNVDVIQGVANSVSVLQENFEGEKATLDYSTSTIGATYVSKSFVLAKEIATNKAFSLYISTNDSSNAYYFNFYNSAGTRIGNNIRVGYGSRKIELTNTYGDAISKIELVVSKIVTQTIYEVSLLVDGESNLDIELSELGKNVSWLPNYLSVPSRYNSMLSTKESSIRDAMLEAGDNGSTFVFITDVHWSENSKYSPALINNILQRLPIEDVFFGGDVINGGDAATQISLISDFGQKMHQAAKRFFSIVGNHDFNTNDGGTGFDGDYFYTLLLKYADYQIVSGEYNNFYYDNDRTKTRYIALNTGTGGDYQTAAQTAWLNNTLSAMGTGYHAIILLHIAYLTATDLTNGTMAPTMAAAAAAADTFNAQADGRKVEAFICGHLHDDANKETAGGIPIILTDCDARQSSSGNTQLIDTVNEQAFDIITINYAGTITCTRIGRGSDRTITY